MSLSAGAKLGPYEIVAPIGAGGMGEVYRAKDTRLGRDVAVKVLPEHLSANPEIRARFEREAKTVSSLNHPNICTLFDVGREGETDYLVMELIEGQTLADRLQRGAIPGAELLRIGMQIADALDRAHRANVIHRDLKPGNVMLTRSGAKLMDFGLARATGLASGPGSSSVATLTHSPTIAKALTAEGTLLGTFQYMSPEQLEGAEADARSDIWALGCVLYEMATGRRAFEGRSQASLIAAILERDPAPIPEAPPSGTTSSTGGTPQGLDRLIRNCLTKDPEERIQTAHDVKLQLRGIGETAGYSTSGFAPATPLPGAAPSGIHPGAAAKPRAASPLPWMIAAIMTATTVALALWLYPRATAPKPVYRFRPVLDVPHAVVVYWPRLSPNGKFLAYAAADSTGINHAWIQSLDEVTPHAIPGAENFGRFYWSPDSKEIAFIADGRILRVPISGGSPVVVAPARGADLCWGSKGLILMDGTRIDSLAVVPAAGGQLTPATRIDRAHGEISHAWPYFLPDGEHFLYIAYKGASTNTGTIKLGKIGSLKSKELGQSDGRVEYAGGWLLYLRENSLVAQKLDLGAGKLTGQPITLAEGLRVGPALGNFSVSSSGVLAYSQAEGDVTNSILITGRDAAVTNAPVVLSGNFRTPRFSPDGKRLLVERRSAFGVNSGEISVIDIARHSETKLTFSGDIATTPRWSPDGRRFAWVTMATGHPPVIHTAPVDGLSAQDSFIVRPWDNAYISQWDPTGPHLVYSITTSNSARVYGIPPEGPHRTAVALADTNQAAAQGEISPDGKWIAFASGRSPAIDVFVQNLSGAGRWQVSTVFGYSPRWTKGGHELLYETFDQRVMAVPIDTKAGFNAGTPQPLFNLPARLATIGVSGWDVDPTGQRFVFIVPPRIPGLGTMEVVTDLSSLVNRK